MSKHLFVVKSRELFKNFFLEILFDKEMNLDENIYCWFRIRSELKDKKIFQKTKKVRFVVEDKMVSIETLSQEINKLISDAIKTLEALERGLNCIHDFYLQTPEVDNSLIKIPIDLKEALQNINEYKLQPYIIDLYTTVLVHYKGSDTLQKRKYEKMIEAQEDAMNFIRSSGRML